MKKGSRIRPPRIALASFVTTTLSLFLLLGGNIAATADPRSQDRILDSDSDTIRYSANGIELPRFRIDGIEPEGGPTTGKFYLPTIK